jgi:hypothetical protein
MLLTRCRCPWVHVMAFETGTVGLNRNRNVSFRTEILELVELQAFSAECQHPHATFSSYHVQTGTRKDSFKLLSYTVPKQLTLPKGYSISVVLSSAMRCYKILRSSMSIRSVLSIIPWFFRTKSSVLWPCKLNTSSSSLSKTTIFGETETSSRRN